MATRNFDAEIASETVVRDTPLDFKLFGTTWDCRDDVNGKLLLDRAADLDGDSVQKQRDGVIGVFEMVILPDQIDSLLDQLDDPDKVIQLAKLVEIVGWLVEQYTERPTQQPSRSPNGHAARGRTSTAKPPAKAASSRRSARQTS